MDERKEHQENRAAWDETAAIYERDLERDIARLRAGGSSLLAPERRLLHDLGAWCGRAIHLQCSGGTDTLSLWTQGAAEVVGVDISARMIAVARRKSDALRAPASWHRCDVLETPETLNGTADLVYTGRGALPWLTDIRAWAQVVSRLLKPDGRLYLFEGHPLDWVWDTNAATFQLDPQRGDYFAETARGERWPAPFLDALELSPEKKPRLHERQWTFGPILNSLVEAGLRLERFEEHPDLYWNQFENLPSETAARLPHTFSLLMRKP
jgi:SAM-dependent methyltransferase